MYATPVTQNSWRHESSLKEIETGVQLITAIYAVVEFSQ